MTNTYLFFRHATAQMLGIEHFCNRHKRFVFCCSILFCSLIIFAFKAMNSNYVQRDEATYLNRIESSKLIGLSASKSLSLPLVAGALLEDYGISCQVGLWLLNFFSTILFAVVIFLMIQRWLGNFMLGILAMLAVGVFYQSVEFALTVLREPVYILCAAVIFLECFDGVASPHCSWHAFCCGLFCILGFWTRIEGVELLVCYPLAILTGVFFGNYSKLVACRKLLYYLGGVVSFGLLVAYLCPDYYPFAFNKLAAYLAGAVNDLF